MNSHPTRFERIMLLTALPPAPPTPITVSRGRSSSSSVGTFRFKVILPSKASPEMGPVHPPGEGRVAGGRFKGFHVASLRFGQRGRLAPPSASGRVAAARHARRERNG